MVDHVLAWYIRIVLALRWRLASGAWFPVAESIANGGISVLAVVTAAGVIITAIISSAFVYLDVDHAPLAGPGARVSGESPSDC